MRETPDDLDAGPTPQLPGESSVAYAMFLKYRDLGPHRTVAELLKTGGKPAEKKCRRQLEFWSARWGWVERAKKFDAHNVAVEQRARDQARAEWAALWEWRRYETMSQVYEDALRLRKRAAEMLDYCLAEEETSEDGKVIIRKPARWSMATAGLLMKLSAELRTAAICPGGEDPPIENMSELEKDAVEAVMPPRQGDGPGPLGL